MKKVMILIGVAISLSLQNLAFAEETEESSAGGVDTCIEAWGTNSPFKMGAKPNKTITTGVKVFGVGKSSGDTEVTEKPHLVLIKPSVNVLGKNIIRLENPNGWYCFKSNVSVLGKISIEAHCKAHLANGTEKGANVLGANENDDKGVTVLGSLRVTRFGCGESSESKQ